MAKVHDMIGDYAAPHGDMGMSVDHETATRIAGEIRERLRAACAVAVAYDAECDHDGLIAAWEHLNAGERRAWKELVSCGHACKR